MAEQPREDRQKEFRYQRKWSWAVCFLAVWAILLIPIGVLSEGTQRIAVLCAAAVMFLAAWWIRLRCLTCQGCGKSCAPLFVKRGTTPVCPYCGMKYLFGDEPRHKKQGSKKK